MDGNNCAVTSAGNGQITCTLAPRNVGISSKLATNSSGQQNPYFGGAGVQYARYTLRSATNTIPNFVAAVRSNNATQLGSPQEVGFRADLREADVYGSNYAQTWKGYFTAPVTGTYTFRGTADDEFAFYFSPTYGSTADLPALPLISSNTAQTMGNYFMDNIANATGSIDLVSGRSYYF